LVEVPYTAETVSIPPPFREQPGRSKTASPTTTDRMRGSKKHEGHPTDRRPSFALILNRMVCLYFRRSPLSTRVCTAKSVKSVNIFLQTGLAPAGHPAVGHPSEAPGGGPVKKEEILASGSGERRDDQTRFDALRVGRPGPGVGD